MDIRSPVRRLLREQKRTQEDMALHLGVSAGTMSRWLTGSVPVTVDNLQSISRYLGVPLWMILKESEQPDPDFDRWVGLYGKVSAHRLSATMMLLEDPEEYKAR